MPHEQPGFRNQKTRHIFSEGNRREVIFIRHGKPARFLQLIDRNQNPGWLVINDNAVGQLRSAHLIVAIAE
jgi:hypothetical protein